ncbi:DUF4360 domain-containing protein [Stackebrandtia sp.]|jgi:hypothetical protein|uniref:DUF4360 domain-containing protein n=1 Tax=Stackebrandtia sp. TaxID=2023065 RepID=UPI0039C8C3A1
MYGGGAALATLALFALPVPAQASGHWDNPPGDHIVIDVATVNGSGCPKDTAAVAVSPDNTAFTVTYSAYLAQAGGNSDPTDFRKNCQIDLNVHVPQGFTYAIASADYRGFASLEAGATALQKASYYFQGMPDTTTAEHPVSSPYADNWEYSDSTDVGQLVYKPCGEERNFNINTELRVSAGTDSSKKSFIEMDSTDGDVNTVYHFAWKTCP